jgi:hypothetical protein
MRRLLAHLGAERATLQVAFATLPSAASATWISAEVLALLAGVARHVSPIRRPCS